jgi:hypothetical protein
LLALVLQALAQVEESRIKEFRIRLLFQGGKERTAFRAQGAFQEIKLSIQGGAERRPDPGNVPRSHASLRSKTSGKERLNLPFRDLVEKCGFFGGSAERLSSPEGRA